MPTRTIFKVKRISFSRYPKTDVVKTLDIKDDLLADNKTFDIIPIVEGKEAVLAVIRKIGAEKFKKYFLYCDHSLTLEELAAECRIDSDEVKKIIDLVNDISIQNSFVSTLTSDLSSQISYSKVAAINKENSSFGIRYFDLCYVKGKYLIRVH